MHTFKKFGVTYEKTRLNNGAEVRLLQRKGAPIHIQACIKAGSRHNTVPGLAHFWEHMLLAGTTAHPSKRAIAKALEEIGGSFEATTDADLLRLTISIPHSGGFEFASNVLNEILTTSAYTEEALENERSVILNEQNDRLKDPTYILQHTLMRLMYVEYERNFNNLGTAASVSAIQREDITEFATKNLTADRVIFVVSGDIDIDAVQKSLATISLAADNNYATPQIPSIQHDKTVSVLDRPDTQSNLAIGFRCDTKNPEELAGLILIQQLAMGRSNPFITALRYNRGLVYGGKTLLWDFNGTSVFSIGTSCASKNVVEVYSIMHEVLAGMLHQGISDTVCEAAQTKTDSHYRFNLQTSKQWLDAEVAAIRHSIEGGIDTNALTILQYIDKMDAHTLTETFKKFFASEKAYHAVIGHVSEEDKRQISKFNIQRQEDLTGKNI